MAPGIFDTPSSGSRSFLPLDTSSNAPLLELPGDQNMTDRLEPIAVVGFSLKFPQEATSADAFWDMMMEKRCAMTEWPKERLNLEAFYPPDTNRLDTVRIPRPRLPAVAFRCLLGCRQLTRHRFLFGGRSFLKSIWGHSTLPFSP